MKNASRTRWAAWFVAAVVAATCPAYADNAPKKPYRLAQDAGCMVCHEVESPPPGTVSLLPLAPSFEDVARRYGADPDAPAKLSETILDGTGPLRRDRHWNGKTRFDRMYPNDLEVSPEEARRIVDWILTLSPAQAHQRNARAERR